MDGSRRVGVVLGPRTYQIHIEAGRLNHAGHVLAPWIDEQVVFVVSDRQVGQLYLGRFIKHSLATAARVETFVVPAGETSKSVAMAETIWNEMVDRRLTRESVVIALGGGVVGDLAGFAAATFMRGIDFIQVPTTLMAQVDSSIGGKVGVNLAQAKNIVGSFWQPRLVLIDPQVLTTLDSREYRSGLAEVVKYGVILDPFLFNYIQEHATHLLELDAAVLEYVIERCCQLKAAVVADDERETSGGRSVLNYGHTFGHALEAAFGYGTYLHGEAVAIGMTCAMRLAVQMGFVPRELLVRQTALLEQFNLPVACPLELIDDLIVAMKRDKKSTRQSMRLVLPTRLGHVELVDWPGDDAVRSAWRGD